MFVHVEVYIQTEGKTDPNHFLLQTVRPLKRDCHTYVEILPIIVIRLTKILIVPKGHGTLTKIEKEDTFIRFFRTILSETDSRKL